MHGVVFLDTPHLAQADHWSDGLAQLLRLPKTQKSKDTASGLAHKDDRDALSRISLECDIAMFPGQLISGYAARKSKIHSHKMFSRIRRTKEVNVCTTLYCCHIHTLTKHGSLAVDDDQCGDFGPW